MPGRASRSARGPGAVLANRHEVRRAATAAAVEALTSIRPGLSPTPVDLVDPSGLGRSRPLMSQGRRAINWSRDGTATVMRKLHAAEGHPGVLDTISGVDWFLFGAHVERGLRGRPGEVIAQRDGAICRATVDGAVWITHLKRRDTGSEKFFKLPATLALGLAGAQLDAPEVCVPVDAPITGDDTYRDITYRERGAVGYLQFDFYNGAMSTEQCRRLRDAYVWARSRSQTRVIVLTGGADFFSNGIHLNVIEAAADPAVESWNNLNAIDDLVREIIDTDSHLVISALRGDADAGGVPLALAADLVFAHHDVVLNPYYGHMGGLYGSEYWTYLLPRRVGTRITARLTAAPFTPIGGPAASEIGLLDDAFGHTAASFGRQVRRIAESLAADTSLPSYLADKCRRRARDEEARPLEDYRARELERCHECFFGSDRSYHHARHRFVYKLGPVCATPGPIVAEQ